MRETVPDFAGGCCRGPGSISGLRLLCCAKKTRDEDPNQLGGPHHDLSIWFPEDITSCCLPRTGLGLCATQQGVQLINELAWRGPHDSHPPHSGHCDLGTWDVICTRCSLNPIT